MTEQQTPPTEAAFFTTIRGWGIARGDSRLLGGVVSGLAERLGWTAVGWTRVGVVVAALILNGLVLLAYAAAWALLPDRQGRIIAQDFGRGTPNVGALVVIGLIGVLGVIGLADSWSPWQWSFGGWPWDNGWPWAGGGAVRGVIGSIAAVLAVLVPLAVVGGAIALIVVLARRGRDGQPAAPRGDGAPPVYAAPPAWAAERQRERAEAAASPPAPAAPATGAYAPTAVPPPTAAPVASSVPAVPAAPVRPPRVPGPGAPFGLLTLSWLVISAGAAAWAGWRGLLAVHPVVAWFALFLTGLGVILVLLALAGRRLGFLAFLSAVLLIPAAIVIANADEVIAGWTGRWLPTIEVVRGDGGDVVRVEVGDGTVWVSEDGDVSVGEPPSTGEATAVPDPDADFDALAAFEDDYSSIRLPAGCFPIDGVPADEGQSRGLISQVSLEDDATATVSAALTTVRIDAGAGLAVVPAAGQSATAYWPDRSVGCDVWDGEELSLDGDAATVTLVTDTVDQYAAIIIEEVAP